MPPVLPIVANATADGSGNIAFTFEQVGPDVVMQGTVAVPTAPVSAHFIANVSGVAIGAFDGYNPWGPVQVPQYERLTLSGSGLTPNAQYQAVWMAAQYPASAAPVPPTPYGSITNIVTNVDNVLTVKPPPYTLLESIPIGGQPNDGYDPGPLTLVQDIVAITFRWRFSTPPSPVPTLVLEANVFSPSSSGTCTTVLGPNPTGGYDGPVVAPMTICVANTGDVLHMLFGCTNAASGAPATFPANLVVDVLAISAYQAVIAQPPIGSVPATGQTKLSTTGTAVPLTTIAFGFNFGTRVRALAANSAAVVLGGNGPGNALTMTSGEVLEPGDVATSPNPPAALWINGNAGDGVSWFVT